MFTGIVSEIGTVESVERNETGIRLGVRAPKTADGLQAGDSIAVNGVCLTAIDHDGSGFTVDVVGETVSRTNLGELDPGRRVNLERPLAGNGRFDGHIVQGHVDGTGIVDAVEPEGDARRVRIAVSDGLAPYIVEKGSVAVDGVSLTVTAVSASGVGRPWFEIVLIPHTLDVTTLGERTPAATVNLETDILAKYIERMMETRR